jgi:hypothetical protein
LSVQFGLSSVLSHGPMFVEIGSDRTTISVTWDRTGAEFVQYNAGPTDQSGPGFNDGPDRSGIET